MAEFVSEDNVVRLNAAADLVCGQMVVVPDGRIGVVQSMRPVKAGEVATARIRGFMVAPAGATMIAGNSVDANLTNQTIVPSGNGVYVGKLLYNTSSGKDAFVDMNP